MSELSTGADEPAACMDESKEEEEQKMETDKELNNDDKVYKDEQIDETKEDEVKDDKKEDDKDKDVVKSRVPQQQPQPTPTSPRQQPGNWSRQTPPRFNRPPWRSSLDNGHGPSTGPGSGETRRTVVNYPLLYVAPTGTISVLLQHDVIVEVAVDKAIRVVCHDKFAAASNGRGTSSCILHHQARIFQQDTKVYSSLGSTGDKSAVFGSQGVLFTMKHLSEAYLVSSSTLRGTSAIPRDRLQFPNLDTDFTLQLFYIEAQTGEQMMAVCEEIVQHAHYERREDGTIAVNVNGVFIRQDKSGDVDVNGRPRHLHFSPSRATVHVRTHFVDMAVQEDEKSYVKRGVKRVHVSRSGLVVSDGNCITSMDHFGRIVSST